MLDLVAGPGSTERDDDAGTSSTANVGFGFGVGGEAGEVDPERQAAFQAHDANPSPVLWVKARRLLCTESLEM